MARGPGWSAPERTPLPRLYTAEQTASLIGVSPEWVRAVAETGVLPAIRLNSSRRSYRISETEIDLWRDAATAAVKAGFDGSWIYFVQPAWGGPIKIGLTTNLRSRFDALQAASPLPLRILTIVPGGRGQEAEYHARFAEWRMHGEWFAWDAPGLAPLIAELREEHGIPDAKALMKGVGITTTQTLLTAIEVTP